MAKNDNSTVSSGTANDPTSKIDAIKQLIFGENMVEYNHEFENRASALFFCLFFQSV